MTRRVWSLLALILAGSAFVRPCEADTPPRLVVAMGTSLTARGGWTESLARALQACYGRAVQVDSMARSGAASTWGLTVVDQVAARAPDVVLIEFATNDAALNRLVTPWTSRANLRSMIETLRHATSRPRVIVMTMNPVFGTGALIRPLLWVYDQGYRRVAAETGATYLDTRPLWAALPEAEQRARIPDGRHPTPAAFRDLLVPALVRTIAGPSCVPDGKL